jgi:uncharacterized protein YqhQ
LSRPPGATVGGQAVIEGVMMRAPSGWAVAVRRPDEVIETVSHELPRLSARSRAAKLPLLRGALVLVESLQLGFRALTWSALKSGEEDEELTKTQTVLTMIVAVAFALTLFIAAPVFVAGLAADESSVWFFVIEGIIRIALLVGYIALISRSDDIQRVFQYHGAEHKTIHAYEQGDPLTIDEIQKFSPRHPRCGTSFLIIVGLVAFVIFLGLAPFDLDWRWQIVSRLVLIPVVAGVSYELLKSAADQRWMAWVSQPGIWLQAVTTKEPDQQQVEVAIASLLAALSDDERIAVEERGPIPHGALDVVVDVDGSTSIS